MFVCKFKYERPNNFQEMCTEQFLFCKIKKSCLPIFLFFPSLPILTKFILDILQKIRDNPIKFQIISCIIVESMREKNDAREVRKTECSSSDNTAPQKKMPILN